MKTFNKITGTILSVAGFLALMTETTNPSMQLFWTLGAGAVLFIGYKMLEKSGSLNEE